MFCINRTENVIKSRAILRQRAAFLSYSEICNVNWLSFTEKL